MAQKAQRLDRVGSGRYTDVGLRRPAEDHHRLELLPPPPRSTARGGILLLPPRSRRFQPPLPPKTLASPSLPPMASTAGGAAGQIPSERQALTMVGNWVLALILVHHFCEGRGASHGAATGRWQRPEENRWGNRPKSIHLQLPPSTNVQFLTFHGRDDRSAPATAS